ncbi:hypothetical protein TNCT_645731 [Trichonephila clavata]|uniref:Uncharacterized protein n=1 Tax=Trichonephila clavata TaxID=2740835 RepID=A0A8X6JMR3_TRICU|nr:hypothetical protein TNCT_645731 [Trichonephila clavata]
MKYYYFQDEKKYGFQYSDLFSDGKFAAQGVQNEPFHAIYTVKKSEKEEERIHYAVDDKGPRTSIHSNLIDFDPRFDPASIHFGVRRWPSDELNVAQQKPFTEPPAPKYKESDKQMSSLPRVVHFKPSQLTVSSKSDDMDTKKQMNTNFELFSQYSIPFNGQFLPDFNSIKTLKNSPSQEKIFTDSFRDKKARKEKLEKEKIVSEFSSVGSMNNLSPDSMRDAFESQRIASPVKIVSYPLPSEKSNLLKDLPVYESHLKDNLVNSSAILPPKIQNLISQTLNPIVERIDASLQNHKNLTFENIKDRILNLKSKVSEDFVPNFKLNKDNDSLPSKNTHQDLFQKPNTSMYYNPNLGLNMDSNSLLSEITQDLHQKPEQSKTFATNLGLNKDNNTFSQKVGNQDVNQKPKTSMYFIPNLGLNLESYSQPQETAQDLNQRIEISTNLGLKKNNNSLLQRAENQDVSQEPKTSMYFVPNLGSKIESYAPPLEIPQDLNQMTKYSEHFVTNPGLNKDNSTLSQAAENQNSSQNPITSMYFVPNLGLNIESYSRPQQNSQDLKQKSETSKPFVTNLGLNNDNTISQKTENQDLSQKPKTSMYFIPNNGLNRDFTSINFNNVPFERNSMPLSSSESFNSSAFSTVFDNSMENGSYYHYVYFRGNDLYDNLNKNSSYFRDISVGNFNENSARLSDAKHKGNTNIKAVIQVENKNNDGSKNFSNFVNSSAFSETGKSVNNTQNAISEPSINKTSDEQMNKYIEQTIEEILNLVDTENPQSELDTMDVEKVMIVINEENPQSEPHIKDVENDGKTAGAENSLSRQDKADIEEIMRMIEEQNANPHPDGMEIEKVMVMIDNDQPQSEPSTKDDEKKMKKTDTENPLSQQDKADIEEIMRMIEEENAKSHPDGMDVEKVMIVIDDEIPQSEPDPTDIEKIMRIIDDTENNNMKAIDVQTSTKLNNNETDTSYFIQDLFENILDGEDFSSQNVSVIYFQPPVPQISSKDENTVELILATTEKPKNMLFIADNLQNDTDNKVQQVIMNRVETVPEKKSTTIPEIADELPTFSSALKTNSADFNTNHLNNLNSSNELSTVIPSSFIMPGPIIGELNNSSEKPNPNRKDERDPLKMKPANVSLNDPLPTMNPLLNKFVEDFSSVSSKNDTVMVETNFDNNVMHKGEDVSDIVNLGNGNETPSEEIKSPELKGNLLKPQNMFSDTQIPVLELFIKHTILNDFLLKINNTPIIIRVVGPDMEGAESIPIITKIKTDELKVLSNNANAEDNDALSSGRNDNMLLMQSNSGDNSDTEKFSQLEIINFKETSEEDFQNLHNLKESETTSTNLPLEIVINKLKVDETSDMLDKSLNLNELKSDSDSINSGILIDPEIEESNTIKLDNTQPISADSNLLIKHKGSKLSFENHHNIEKYKRQQFYIQNRLQEINNPFLKLWKGKSGVEFVPFGVKEAYKVIPVFQEVDNYITPDDSQILQREVDAFDVSGSHSSGLESETSLATNNLDIAPTILTEYIDTNKQDGLRGNVQYVDFVPYQDVDYDNYV